jgi:hypothetical protein
MKGDFSRLVRFPGATRVLSQQGRVQLDADWNELVAILVERTREGTRDLIGAHGGPQGTLGYAIQVAASAPPGMAIARGDFGIAGGTYYVEGWACRTGSVPYTAQPDLPGAAPLTSGDASSTAAPLIELWGGVPNNLAGASQWIAYLDVWERHVSAAEDERLAEVALGGVDTTTRAVLMAQVRVVPAPAGAPSADAAAAHLRTLFPEDLRPQLKARAKEVPNDPDACLSDPDARFRGVENQLYRVEVHRGGPPGQATFKWSRDNGSVVFPVRQDKWAARIRLAHLGRDDRSTLNEGDWVELVDEVLAKHGAPGPMLRVEKVDRDEMSVEVGGSVGILRSLVKPVLRRWDHRAGLPAEGGAELEDGALLVAEAEGEVGWLKLEDGVEVQFQKSAPPSPRYRSGDYWLIPARTATGDIEWQRNNQGEALPAPPRGVRHFYAPLALISLLADGNITKHADYRRAFEELAKPLP